MIRNSIRISLSAVQVFCIPGAKIRNIKEKENWNKKIPDETKHRKDTEKEHMTEKETKHRKDKSKRKKNMGKYIGNMKNKKNQSKLFKLRSSSTSPNVFCSKKKVEPRANSKFFEEHLKRYSSF